MADGNPFTVTPPNVLQALMFGQQSFNEAQNTMRENQIRQARADAAKLFGQGDTQGALTQLMALDPQGARAVGELANQKAQRELQARGLGLQERQVNLAEQAAQEKPTYQKFTRPDGSEALIKIDPFGKGITDVTPAELKSSGANPFYGGKVNETQAKDQLYAGRMINAESIFRQPDVLAAAGDITERPRAAVPLIGNYLVSSGFQKYDQAARDFINAVLRRESGAVISESEFANARVQYLPQPGDSKEKLAQKQRNRAEAIRGIAAGGSAGWKPPEALKTMPDILGGGGAELKPAPANVLQEAKAAIAKGAPRDAVIQRLQQQGFAPAGL
jgi:hypothetical protein